MKKGGNKVDGKNILFVCSANVKRSPSAEFWFSCTASQNNYSSAGSSEFACRKYGGNYLQKYDLENADRIICMENRNKSDIEKNFGSGYNPKIEVAGIKDHYEFLQLDLIYEFIDKISC